MAVIGDIEAKYKLPAIRSEILVVAVAQLSGFGFLVLIHNHIPS